MNTLALIKKHLTRQAKVEAYNKSIAYRGVKYTPSNEVAEKKGCYVYRGRTYCKWINKGEWRYIPLFYETLL